LALAKATLKEAEDTLAIKLAEVKVVVDKVAALEADC
jgi:hypothetical protein